MTLPERSALRVAGSARETGLFAAVHDPFRGEVVGEITLADAAAADDAARHAASLVARGRRTPAFERRRLLRNVVAGVEREAEALATLIARESGKPITLARGEVKRAIATLELGAEESTRLGGEIVDVDVAEASAGYTASWRRVAAGAVLGIAPFNFPLNLVCHKVAPALAAGCPIVLKPAPQAPLTALALGAIVDAAGGPPGMLQVVPCEVDVAERLVRDDRFRVLSFTGSAKVGWHLASIAGRKRALLELGGNAACLVHEDADLAWALGRTVTAAFAYAGQVCIKTQRLFLHEPIAERFEAELGRRVAAIEARDPLDPSTLMGPLIDEASARRVEAWVDDAVAKGARVLHRGARREGARLGPVVLGIEGDGRGLAVVDEEVFGPVLTVHRYRTFGEGLAMANASRYGLQASVFTRDLDRVAEASRALDVGGLIVNDSTVFRVDAMPYGGVRDSGLGREGVRHAIDEMTEKRLVVVRGAIDDSTV